ncbi:MAG TPA: hypothetical protein VF077_09775 [Nitrospiraceae bacterium]
MTELTYRSRALNDTQHIVVCYAQDPDKRLIHRFDFDRPIVLKEIRIGILIVAVSDKDPMVSHCPDLAVVESCERSRYVPEKPFLVQVGYCIHVTADRPFEMYEPRIQI